MGTDVGRGGEVSRTMAGTEPLVASTPRTRGNVGFRETLPLLIASAVLFAAGAVTWWAGVRVGPPRFPLWALLVVLGFVAAIGSVLAAFLGGDETVTVPPATDKEIEDARSTPPAVELGRPAPDVRRPEQPPVVPSAVPWDEGPVESSRPAPVAAPAPRPWTDVDAEVAMRELEGIEQEIAPRRRPPQTGVRPDRDPTGPL